MEMDITEVYNSIDDITDPSSMVTVWMYVEFIKARDQDFIELLMEKIPYMEITWEQPWYQQYKSLTRPLISIENNNKETFRKDKINHTESKRILKNWRKFRKHFDIPDSLECFARWRNTCKSRNPHTPEEKVRCYVTAYLAKGLERTLYQVYKHVVAHYGCPNRGHYSLQEEKIMEVCFYHNTRNAIPILSKVLGREPRSIYKKLEEWLHGKPDKKRMLWTLPAATKLLKLLLEHTGIPLEELKYKRFDKSVWLELQKEMDHSYLYLQMFWYNKLHVQIFVKKHVKINKIRRKIVQILQESPYQVWGDIRWKELVNKFPDGFTHGFLYKVWANIFRGHKEISKLSLNEIIKYALDRIPMLPSKRLKLLKLNESGELTEIKYKKEL